MRSLEIKNSVKNLKKTKIIIKSGQSDIKEASNDDKYFDDSFKSSY